VINKFGYSVRNTVIKTLEASPWGFFCLKRREDIKVGRMYLKDEIETELEQESGL